MERVCKFLKDAGVYYLATVEGDQPRVRPFGTAHIFEGRLYIQTGKGKPCSKQIRENPKVEICAFHNGTWIRVAGELMYKNLLDPEVLPYLYECACKNHFAIVTYDGEYVLTEYPDDEYVLKEALLNVMKIKKVDNFLEAVKHPIAKCLIVGEPERLAVLEKEMYEVLKDRMGVFRSEPYFLELVPKGIDKAQSLSVLLSEIGMTREEMIAIGDGFNDLSMIKYAGLGVAMANAQPVVRENADFITLSNEEDGVAHVVRKFML